MSVLNLLNTKVVVGVGFLYVLAHLVGRRRGRRSLPYPPGPKGESNCYTGVGETEYLIRLPPHRERSRYAPVERMGNLHKMAGNIRYTSISHQPFSY